MEIIENLDKQYLEKLENIEFQPVFILGLHRSGTSILYKILIATKTFNPVTAYHLIKYNQLIYNYLHKKEETVKKQLTSFFKEQGQTDRGIDRLELTADFPEEYGFLLGQKTVEMRLTPKNLPLFIEMAKKIQFISNNDKPLLLKNPYDLPNFLYIKQVFPNTKFIFIHRHPFKTLSSSIKALRFLYKNKNPYTTQIYRFYNKTFENPLLLHAFRLLISKFFPFGVIFLTLYSRRSIKYYLKNIKYLPEENYTVITYEDLCKNPQDTMENIMKFLKIETKEKTDFTIFIKPRKTHLDPSVIKLQKFIFKNMKHYFKCFRYKQETNNL